MYLPVCNVCLLVLWYVVHVYILLYCFGSVRDNQPQEQPPPQQRDQQDPPYQPNPLDGQQNPNDNAQTEANQEGHVHVRNVKCIIVT